MHHFLFPAVCFAPPSTDVTVTCLVSVVWQFDSVVYCLIMAKRQSQTSIIDFITCKRNTAASESRPDTEGWLIDWVRLNVPPTHYRFTISDQLQSLSRRQLTYHHQSSSQKTRLNYLSHGMKILTKFSSVMSQSTRLTDGRTDGQKEFSSLDRVCISCSAVKIGRLGVRQKSIPPAYHTPKNRPPGVRTPN